MASRLEQVTVARLSEIRDYFRSGLSELTGKARKWGEGNEVEYGARFRGVKSAFPELRHVKQSPAVIARAIERGKGKVFRIVKESVREEFREAYPEAGRGKLSVAPHESLTRKCRHCVEAHSKSEHRFHGRGAWLQTHLFPFKRNPVMTEKKAREYVAFYSRLGAQIGLTVQEKRLLSHVRQFLRRLRRPAMNPSKKIGAGDPCKVRGCPASGSVPHGHTKDGLPIFERKKRKNPSPGGKVRIYGKLLRIEAKKTGKHRCDAACRKAGHNYYHDFGPGAVIYGNPDGSLRIVSILGKRLWDWF